MIDRESQIDFETPINANVVGSDQNQGILVTRSGQ